MLGNNRVAQIQVVWDVNVALVGKDTCVKTPVREVGVNGRENLTRECLEGSEDNRIGGGRSSQLRGELDIDEVDIERLGEEGDRVIIQVGGQEEVRTVGESIRGIGEISGNMDHFQLSPWLVQVPSWFTLFDTCFMNLHQHVSFHHFSSRGSHASKMTGQSYHDLERTIVLMLDSIEKVTDDFICAIVKFITMHKNLYILIPQFLPWRLHWQNFMLGS